MKFKSIICFVFFALTFLTPIAHPFDYSDKKVLYVNSYHAGYEFSDQEQDAAVKALSSAGVQVKVVYMDTKNNPSEDFKEKAGFEVKKIIKGYRPDVLIVADDNAFKYVVAPYYRDAKLPVVFCGINWDISEYGAPYKNTTGMIEIGHIEIVYKQIERFLNGDRVGFLGPDVLSEHKNATYYGKLIEGGFDRIEFVLDFETWKSKYIQLQDEVDLIIISGSAGIKGWQEKEAAEFGFNNMKVAMGTELAEMMSFCLVGAVKKAEEQGEYAAYAALEILKGKRPSDVPIVMNKKGDLMINLKVADKLNIVFTPAILRNAVAIYGLEE
jgi:ABC transporter substrate binding protein